MTDDVAEIFESLWLGMYVDGKSVDHIVEHARQGYAVMHGRREPDGFLYVDDAEVAHISAGAVRDAIGRQLAKVNARFREEEAT